MRHEHLARSLVEQMQVAQTPSGSDGIFHGTPEAFDRIKMMTAMGRQ
jgi:hypothetical protein